MSTALQNTSPAFAEHPSRLFLEPTTRCNLGCRMCVKHSSGVYLPEGMMEWRTFQALVPALSGLEALVLSGIGEPLLHPQLEEFVRRAKTEMPPGSWVGIQSNGSLLDRRRALSLARAGVDRLCLSLDALDPRVLAGIRRGGRVSMVEEALAAGRAAAREYPGLRLGVEVVLMEANQDELPHLVEWAAGRGVDFMLVSQMLPYDQSMVSQVVYGPDCDASVELFEQWWRRARQQGVDLGLYLGTFLKYNYTPQEQRAIDLVEGMKAEALARDIPLNIRRLLERRHPPQPERAGRVLEQARQRARELGLEITLPAPRPRQQRRCPFVEDGGTFVSYQGKVHPCYFLWHHYACYLDGRRKEVRPRVFGDLARRSLLEIWQDEAYRNFRREVLLYDYPHCGNCNVCPCDFIDQEEFVSDCYTIEVPCGDCPWCQGLLVCLQ